MTLRFGLSLCATAVTAVALLGLLPALPADEPSRPDQPMREDVGSRSEVQDIVFFTDKRPVLVRVHLFNDGKPACERWDEFQKKLFEYLDVDGNGSLDTEELKRAPSAAMLEQFFAGGTGGNGIQTGPTMEDFRKALDKNPSVSPAELAEYYRKNGAGPYNAYTGSGRVNTADQLTNALFGALDTNRDGKLSKEELSVAHKVLMKFDDNDDELITPQELLAVAANPYGNTPPPPVRRNLETTSILLVPKDAKGRITERYKFAKDVLTKYDKDKNGRLSREEIGFPKEVFDSLRKDGNTGDQLTAEELRSWVIAPTPDLELTVHMGRVEPGVKPIDPANDGKGRGGLKLNTTSATTLALTLDSSEVSVMRGDMTRAGGRNAPGLMQLFKTLDKDKKGFITLEQTKQPQFLPLFTIFTLADRDTNEKLTEKELQAFIDLTTAAAGCQVNMVFSDNGQGLFDMLDTNSDGRLSLREMRNAWNRLAMHDHDGDGCISRDEIPRQYQLLVGGAPPNYGAPNQPQMVDRMGQMQTPRTPLPQRGPLWFRKMDVNGDGDVSEREWLGSLEDFRRINTSGDGLISVEEAEKADAWFRQKLQQK